MRDLFFECQSGISGDMILGALIDLGLDLPALTERLQTLPLTGFRLEAERIKRKGVMGTQLHVEVDEARDIHRTWPEVRDIVRAARFTPTVESRALAAFEKLARAEATVHNTDIERIHFHEVGCLDAIVDITGAMLGLELLDIQTIRCSPLNVGHGTVKCRHGVMPVPAPATVELLKGVACYQNDLGGELVTPTGAAIITTLTDHFAPMPEFQTDRIGYGAGTREYPDRPNYLRILQGRFAESRQFQGLEHRTLALLTTEMDDESGETFTPLIDALLTAGALDAHLTPIQMKKNRPGIRLSVLADESAVSPLVDLVLTHTSTLGVKVQKVDRYCLPRRCETVQTRYGAVAVKLAERHGRVLKGKPEFASCLACAQAAGVPLREVMLQAQSQIATQFLTNTNGAS